MRVLRLASAVLVAVAVTSACDSPSNPGAPTARSEQVLSTASASLPATPPSGAAHAASPTRAGKLCEGDANAKGRTLPRLTLPVVAPAGPTQEEVALPPGGGQWTWVNFWAAWCGPCKEEMPRLSAFQEKLAKAGAPVRFVFVSLDDDARQLQDFLARQPQDGLRSSLWLSEGPKRTTMLSGLRMKSAPELPEQALLDPSGRVRCFVEGAVEDRDYDEIAALVRR
jgi:thiol-disulfide isomerase/thioredoxin